MAAGSFARRSLWLYSHSLSVLFAVLLFTAGFLCTLLWTNGIVQTPTSAAAASTSTFTYYSPAVSTFTITYDVGIFGAAWNTLVVVALLLLEGDTLPFLSTERVRYEAEKAAIVVGAVGNIIYAIAAIALMSTLGELAANAYTSNTGGYGADRRAGQGTTAAMAGLAAITALFACAMDVLHALNSRHRRNVKQEPLRMGDETVKQA